MTQDKRPIKNESETPNAEIYEMGYKPWSGPLSDHRLGIVEIMRMVWTSNWKRKSVRRMMIVSCFPMVIMVMGLYINSLDFGDIKTFINIETEALCGIAVGFNLEVGFTDDAVGVDGGDVEAGNVAVF